MRRATRALGAAAAMTLLILTGCGSGNDAQSDTGEASAPQDASGPGSSGGSGGGSAADSNSGAADSAGSGANEEESADGSSADGDPAGGDDGGLIDPAAFTASVGDIIYTVDLSIRTDDVAASARAAADIAVNGGGFVADERSGNGSATLTLRVPSDVHIDIVGKLEELGEVTDRSRTANDVTQEVSDTKSRIASQRASIGRIRALLGEADKLGDIVNIESELATREADLDALLSRQKELAGLTSLATVTVSFHEHAEAPPEDDEEFGGFLSGLGGGWDAFVSAGAVALTIAGAVVPFAVLGAVVGIPAYVVIRRRRGAAEAPPADPGAQAPAV